MFLAFTPEQEELRASLRSFFAAHSSTEQLRRVMESADAYDRALWKRMATELGLPGIALPEEFGGSGYSIIEQIIILEEMGRGLVCSPYFATVILAATALLESGDASAQQDYLPGIADGTTLATLALAEEDGEWSADAGATTAVPGDGGYVLEGAKSYVIDGQVAGLLLVVAQAPSGPGLFAVDATAPGLSRRLLHTLDETRKLAAIEFRGTPARLIGAEGDASRVVSATMAVAAVALAVEQVGGADRCLELTVEYAKLRTQFGRPIGGFQAIKHKCANLLMHVESARSAAYYAAWAVLERSAELPLAASLAKAYCSDTFTLASAQMIHIHGGIGFTWEHDAHLYYRRARSAAVLFGTPEQHRDIVAGLLLDSGPVG